MNLKGKVAVVTGASTGIGKAIAQALATKGAIVVLAGRNSASLNETLEKITKKRGKAQIFNVDLSDIESINNLASDVRNNLGDVHIVANVAGVWHSQESVYYGLRLDQIPPNQINDVLNVNMRAPMLLTRLFVPDMIKKRAGKILNISGTFSNGGANWIHYYVSKLAVEHFTIALADELREFEIQVNCISPSDVATDAFLRFFPKEADTALKPKEVADLALFLVSKSADHITGQTIVIKSKTDTSK